VTEGTAAGGTAPSAKEPEAVEAAAPLGEGPAREAAAPPGGPKAGPPDGPEAGPPEAPLRGTPGIPRAGESARGTPGIPSRPRGLAAPYIPGGDDPEIAETRRRERPYMRMLIGMVVVIVGGTLVLTILAIASSILYR
jgi:hypothetical protein